MAVRGSSLHSAGAEESHDRLASPPSLCGRLPLLPPRGWPVLLLLSLPQTGPRVAHIYLNPLFRLRFSYTCVLVPLCLVLTNKTASNCQFKLPDFYGTVNVLQKLNFCTHVRALLVYSLLKFVFCSFTSLCFRPHSPSPSSLSSLSLLSLPPPSPPSPSSLSPLSLLPLLPLPPLSTRWWASLSVKLQYSLPFCASRRFWPRRLD